jgi:hypothetical protein
MISLAFVVLDKLSESAAQVSFAKRNDLFAASYSSSASSMCAKTSSKGLSRPAAEPLAHRVLEPRHFSLQRRAKQLILGREAVNETALADSGTLGDVPGGRTGRSLMASGAPSAWPRAFRATR